jgi:hypothetical protein
VNGTTWLDVGLFVIDQRSHYLLVLDKMRVQLAETLIEVSNVEFRHLV